MENKGKKKAESKGKDKVNKKKVEETKVKKPTKKAVQRKTATKPAKQPANVVAEQSTLHNKKANKKSLNLFGYGSIALAVIMVLIAVMLVSLNGTRERLFKSLTPEERLAMTYTKVQEGEDVVEGTNILYLMPLFCVT